MVARPRVALGRRSRRSAPAEAGTGYGLSIVEGVVDAHGWEIDLQEGEGRGARFDVTVD